MKVAIASVVITLGAFVGGLFGVVAHAGAQPAFCDRNESPIGSGSDHTPGHIYITACGTENTGNGGCDDDGPGCTKYDGDSGGTDDNVPPGSGIN